MSNVQSAFSEDEINRFNAEYVGHADLIFQTVFGVCLSQSKSVDFTYATFTQLTSNLSKTLAHPNPKLNCLGILSRIVLADNLEIAPANRDRNKLLASLEKNARLVLILVDFAGLLVDEAASVMDIDAVKVRKLLASAREKLTN